MLANYRAELDRAERELDDVVAPNALAEPRRAAAQCRDALAKLDPAAAVPAFVEALFAKLRAAVKAIPPSARRAPLRNDARYVPPPELEAVLQHLRGPGTEGGARQPVWLFGAPGLGKTALACALHDRYHSARSLLLCFLVRLCSVPDHCHLAVPRNAC